MPPTSHRPTRFIAVTRLLIVALASPALAQDAILSPGADGGGGDGGGGGAPPQTPAVQIVPNTPPPKEHDEDALALLGRVEQAIEDLESFRTTMVLSATRAFRDFSDQGEVSVVARRSPDDRDLWQVRITGALEPERSRDLTPIDASFDGQRMRWVDPNEERIGARVLPVRMRTVYFDTAIRLRDRLFIADKPLDEIRACHRLFIDDPRTIDGVECEVLVGEPAEGTFRFELYIGAEDHLPRRHVQRAEVGPMFQGTSEADYKDFEPGARVSDAAFVIPVPDGWFEEQFPRPITPSPMPIPTNANEDGTMDEGGTPEGDGDSAAEAEAIEGASRNNAPRTTPANPSATRRDPSSGVVTAASGDGSTDADGDGMPDGAATTTTRPGTTPPSRATSAAGADIEVAPDFALKDRDAQTVRLSELAGQRVVIVFWGSWNPWARSLLGELRPALEDAENTRLLVLGVRERSEAAAREQFDRQSGPGTLLLGAERVAADYKVDAVPTVVVVDENGRVLLRHVGFAASASPVERVLEVLGINADE